MRENSERRLVGQIAAEEGKEKRKGKCSHARKLDPIGCSAGIILAVTS